MSSKRPQAEAGKGDAQRPTNQSKFNEGWERIFGSHPKPEKKPDENREQ
jgi:hypothetical protein